MSASDRLMSRRPLPVDVASQLSGIRPVGDAYVARCPAHDDHNPSLSLKVDEGGKLLLHCHAGCDQQSVLDALHATPEMLNPDREDRRGEWTPRGEAIAVYPYTDADGKLLFQVCRTADKQFPQRRPDKAKKSGWNWSLGDVPRVLYRLPEVIAAVEAGQVVYAVEGERDANAIVNAGECGTCSPGGAGKWLDTYAEALRDANVVVVADKDEPGRAHARTVAASLRRVGAVVVVVEAAVGKDAADHLAAGLTLDELRPPLALDLERALEPATAPPVDVRRLVLTTATAVQPERQRWLWADRIPAGALCLLAGREGLGKSTIAVDLAAQVTRGELAGELHGQPRDVLIVATEDNRATTIVPRLIAGGADLHRVHFADVEEDGVTGAPVFPVDTDRLADAARARRAALVILDAATSVIDGRLDGDRDRQMRQALEPLGRMAADLDASVLGVVHFGKRADADTGKLILGSIAWSQVARSVLAVAVDEDSGVLLVQPTKHNLGPGDVRSIAARIVPATVPTGNGPTSVGRVEWLGEVESDARDHLGRREGDTEDARDRDEAGIWLLDHLSEHDGEAPAGEVLKAALKDGFPARTMQAARKRVGVRSSKSSLRGGWVWTLNPEGAAKAPKAHEHNAPAPSAPSVAPSPEPDDLDAATRLVIDQLGATVLHHTDERNNR